jgi:hypothetical protein
VHRDHCADIPIQQQREGNVLLMIVFLIWLTTAQWLYQSLLVLHNPLVMAAWGLFVAVTLVIGSLPFFVGLALVLLVLAHSTWHLYRTVVEPDLGPRQDSHPDSHPRTKGRRYAADFPAVLFPWTHEGGPTRSPPQKIEPE